MKQQQVLNSEWPTRLSWSGLSLFQSVYRLPMNHDISRQQPCLTGGLSLLTLLSENSLNVEMTSVALTVKRHLRLYPESTKAQRTWPANQIWPSVEMKVTMASEEWWRSVMHPELRAHSVEKKWTGIKIKNDYKQHPHACWWDVKQQRGPGRPSSDVGGAQGAVCVTTRGGRFLFFQA